jgi:hypothetical protein
MPDQEVEQQGVFATNFAAAILAIERRLTEADGALAVGPIDPAVEGLDADTVEQLIASLNEANDQISRGEIALAELGVEGVANA